MVSVAHFIDDAAVIFEEIQRREDEAEEARLKEFLAARRIQASWRGHIERRHLARLHRSAVFIQTAWRGYWARVLYLRMLAEALAEMERKRYHRAATMIQAWWRGISVRMRVFSVADRKRWAAEVAEKNAELLQRIKEQQERARREAARTLEAEAKEWVLFVLFKLHHLTRTRQIPGVFSLRDTQELSQLEAQLEAIGFMDYKVVERHVVKPDPDLIFSGRLRKCEKFWYTRDVSSLWAELDRQTQLTNHRVRCINPPLRFPRFTLTGDPIVHEPGNPSSPRGSIRVKRNQTPKDQPLADKNVKPGQSTPSKALSGELRAISSQGGFVQVTAAGKLKDKVLFTPQRREQFDTWLA